MIRTTLLVLILVSLAKAQPFPSTLPDQVTSLPSSDSRCSTTEFQTAPWVREVYTQYTAALTGSPGICYLANFISPCATLSGAQRCNDYNETCESINSDIDFASTVLHPEIVSITSQRPQVCSSQGAFLHPDAIVFTIVLIIVGWLILIALLVRVLSVVRPQRAGAFLTGVVISSFILCTMLLFSYYYLNAVLVMGCVYVSYSLFSTKRADCTAFGFLILIGGMFWTLHASSLGWVQHMSRFGNSATDASVNMCINYYRGYFAYPISLQSDFDNPLVNSKQLCRSEWLSAELFFMILLQLVMLLAVVAGAAVRTTSTSVKQVKVSELDRTDLA